MLEETGYSIFGSFSTAILAVCEVFAGSDLMSELDVKKIRSNTISRLLLKNPVNYIN